MANFLFYKYRFEKTGERTLFSAEDNAHVSNEYLNDKFAGKHSVKYDFQFD